MRLYEVIENQYSEVEFVCHNEQHPDSTQTDSQQALMRDLQNMKGVVVLCQDWSSEHDGRQISLSAIVLDRSLLSQVKAAARRHGVEIDMINKVNDDYVNRAIRGEHDGQVMEGRFQNAALAGLAAASLAGAMNTAARLERQAELDKIPEPKVQQLHTELPGDVEEPVAQPEKEVAAERHPKADAWGDAIAKRYRVDVGMARQVAALAVKYEDDVFPKAIDILAVIGVESSFNPKAVSRLRRDPARGLMQVRPRVWGLEISDLDDIEEQIRIGARILKKYHGRAGSDIGAFHAYNMGITNYRRGKKNPAYVAKVKREKSFLEEI